MLDSVAPAPDESRPVVRFEHVLETALVFFQRQVVPAQSPTAHTTRTMFRVAVQFHEGKPSLSQDGHDHAMSAPKLISVHPCPVMAVQDVHNRSPHADLLMRTDHSLLRPSRPEIRPQTGRCF